MGQRLVVAALLVGAAALLAGGGWLLGGGTGLALAVVVGSPIVALAVAPLLPSLLGGSVRAVRAIAYRDIEGRHYAYKGRSIQVHDDEAGDRWLRVTDVRKVVPGFPRDAVLLRIAPADVGRVAGRGELFLRAQALDAYLQRSQDDTALRFRHWLHKEVIAPAGRARAALAERRAP
jgi:hypothetical protein